MPRSWPRKPDRKTDGEFRRADDRMNFIVHGMAYLTVNSGIWFVDIIKQAAWSWPVWFSLVWMGVLVLNLIYISAIADYSETSNG
jgi:hypothetical protein